MESGQDDERGSAGGVLSLESAAKGGSADGISRVSSSSSTLLSSSSSSSFFFFLGAVLSCPGGDTTVASVVSKSASMGCGGGSGSGPSSSDFRDDDAEVCVLQDRGRWVRFEFLCGFTSLSFWMRRHRSCEARRSTEET